ncbi:MAG: helix-turn-helix transcriptional regulator [Dorea sp.]|nr:helix-turn-helix transcriptional regulator [Dorea sp.]
MNFADKLKKLRKMNSMTQEEVAQRLGLSRSTIAGYESGIKGRQPSREGLAAFAKLYGVTLDYLVNDEIINIDISPCSSLSKDEERLLNDYRNLSLAARELVREQICTLEKYNIKYKEQQLP